MVIGANCYGDSSPLVAGTQYSSVLVAGQLEGQFFIQMVARYFASGGKVDQGTYTAPSTADSAPTLPSTVHKFNYLPQPVVVIGKGSTAKNQAALDSAKLWGLRSRNSASIDTASPPTCPYGHVGGGQRGMHRADCHRGTQRWSQTPRPPAEHHPAAPAPSCG